MNRQHNNVCNSKTFCKIHSLVYILGNALNGRRHSYGDDTRDLHVTFKQEPEAQQIFHDNVNSAICSCISGKSLLKIF